MKGLASPFGVPIRYTPQTTWRDVREPSWLQPGLPAAPGGDRALAGLGARGRRRPPQNECDRPLRGSQLETRLSRHGRANTRLDVAAGTVLTVSTAALTIQPWGSIAAGAGYALGIGLKVAAAVRRRRGLALAGDEAAIERWVRRMARWSARKRARKGQALLKDLHRLVGRCSRKEGRDRKVRTKLLIRIARLRLKLAALAGTQASASLSRSEPVVAGEPDTAPERVDSSVEGNADSPLDDEDGSGNGTIYGLPTGPVVAGGILLVTLGILAVSKKRRAP